jgi:hypothetical protein
MYSLEFVDGSIFVGGNPDNSKWGNIPNKLIKELQYDYLGKEITLTNFEAYNHLVKYTYMLATQEQVMTGVIIMVKEFDIVTRFCYDLIKNELIVDKIEYGKEYNNKPASGWRAGLMGEKTKFKID